MKSICRLSAWLPAILALGVAHAQTHADDPTDPSDPSIHAPLPAYRSAFDGYRSASESVQHNASETTGMHHQQAMQMSDEHVRHSMQMHSAHHHMEEEAK